VKFGIAKQTIGHIFNPILYQFIPNFLQNKFYVKITVAYLPIFCINFETLKVNFFG